MGFRTATVADSPGAAAGPSAAPGHPSALSHDLENPTAPRSSGVGASTGAAQARDDASHPPFVRPALPTPTAVVSSPLTGTPVAGLRPESGAVSGGSHTSHSGVSVAPCDPWPAPDSPRSPSDEVRAPSEPGSARLRTPTPRSADACDRTPGGTTTRSRADEFARNRHFPVSRGHAVRVRTPPGTAFLPRTMAEEFHRDRRDADEREQERIDSAEVFYRDARPCRMGADGRLRPGFHSHLGDHHEGWRGQPNRVHDFGDYDLGTDDREAERIFAHREDNWTRLPTAASIVRAPTSGPALASVRTTLHATDSIALNCTTTDEA